MPPARVPTRLICPLTADNPRDMRSAMLAAARAGAEAVECRLDYLSQPPGPADLAMLLADPPVDVIVTCRPPRQGGRWRGGEDARLALLRQAAEHRPTYIDVELDVPSSAFPPGQILLSHHDFEACPADLDGIVRRLEGSAAAAWKVAFHAAGPQDALRALEVCRGASRPAIALAMGEAGVLSRVLAPKFGALGTFAALEAGCESAPGQLTLRQMRELYRWDRIGPGTAVYGVIGCPVAHSMSPAIHNRAFDAAGLDAVYLPLLVQAGAEHFQRFLDALRDRPWLDWRGLSVTIPHKENALAYVGADRCEELARKIGAINTIRIAPDGSLRGDNTDYAAALDALCSAMGIHRAALAGRDVAVLGAGGAARAVVAALDHVGARVAIYNRTVSRAERLAEEFHAQAFPLDALGQTDCQVVINCTPIGMYPNIDRSPMATIPRAVRVVFDTIYNPLDTRLLQLARRARCLTVSGLEMFVNQAVAQFELWTGQPAPREPMRQVVLQSLARH